MRTLIGSVLLLMLFAQEQMVAPKVEHKKHEETTTYDEVIRSCPAGYEGHFVDVRAGFDWQYWNGEGGSWSFAYGWGYNLDGQGEVGYTVCFKKEFMDKIRKNPDLLAPKPAPPRPV
jgi:hypothetical protein